MSQDTVRILNGNTFVVSDRQGDITPSPEFPTGLFSFDTRFLSKWELSVNGERLQALSVDDLQHFETRFFLVPGKPTHYVDAKVSVIRQRSVGGSLDEQLTVLNHSREPVDLMIRLDIESDFADLFEIKDTRHKKGNVYVRLEHGRLRLGYERETFRRETLVSSTVPGTFDENGVTFDVRIQPHGKWVTRLHVATLGTRGSEIRRSMHGQPTPARRQMRRELERWLARAPDLTCQNESLQRSYRRSLVDLAALQLTPLLHGTINIPAAGLPWFMTIFGRDSILTSLQTLPFTPDLAANTLTLMASMQGNKLYDFRDEEPGKIMHEWRYGESAAFEEQPHTSYFGTADATPLFVILLDEYERWSGDSHLVGLLEPEARAALDWIDEYGDLLGDGYIRYQTRNERSGLVNQCWKDSWDSISFHDGRLPDFPRATCELQGYAYDAKVRGARLARDFWGDPEYADRLEREAADLRARFNRDFWVEDREFYALGLDPDGRPVDSLSSNMGHLLWSGIVDPSRAEAVARHLLGPRLFSGWGVRTLAVDEGRYNPIGYHVGTVWPFDNSLIAWGLWRYGFRAEAGRIAAGMIDAAEFFHGRLPEAFAGYDRELTRYPVEYPTACSPQAWSTGTPLLLLRVILGLEPDGDRLLVEPAVPTSIGRIELRNIPGRWGHASATSG
ncbi:glycogen debranching N-terminal domain-containing protein [Micromonospora inyonensis]|uniref:Glycogen debranching enzyme (Alpha-1,6-glucosidase) n=1 Tax=Micromonospora inyonensis TaxID=47866 RepID=A0A1C6RMP1_9ACTN|nr:glycogen debranching N-terminal domain-containing protein [Micromonospora inyonensis]SCL18448.1 Glycogen debranching enzyme (alpha-1,6-glucosidase) [Micromonospora inyonensis]